MDRTIEHYQPQEKEGVYCKIEMEEEVVTLVVFDTKDDTEARYTTSLRELYSIYGFLGGFFKTLGDKIDMQKEKGWEARFFDEIKRG